jgi:hypothetical protein
MVPAAVPAAQEAEVAEGAGDEMLAALSRRSLRALSRSRSLHMAGDTPARTDTAMCAVGLADRHAPDRSSGDNAARTSAL